MCFIPSFVVSIPYYVNFQCSDTLKFRNYRHLENVSDHQFIFILYNPDIDHYFILNVDRVLVSLCYRSCQHLTCSSPLGLWWQSECSTCRPWAFVSL